MKKRMLVTTIALVLVIAVALTTSSLAWFSSSSSVTTGNVTFTATTASGANLVLGDLGDVTLDDYDAAARELPDGTAMSPAQGLPALGTLNTDFTVANNKITYNTNPFLGATNVEQLTGFDVANQQVDLVANGAYLAGGFNYANATGDALANGVTVKATITLATVEADTAATDNKVNKGYIAYDGSAWKSAGADVTASAVFFKSVDVALLASVRIAMFGAANVTSGATFGTATIYDFNGTGVVLTSKGYAVGAAGSNDKYATAAGTDVKGTVVTDPENGTSYGTINHIDMGEKGTDTYTFTFSQAFNTPIAAGNAGSIAYVIWMDGWDESALPGVSAGTFGMTFEVSVG